MAPSRVDLAVRSTVSNIDGVATVPTANSVAVSGTVSDNDRLLLGRGSKDASNSWNGRIDEFRIYNRVLTSDEIDSLGESAPTNVGPLVEAVVPMKVIQRSQSTWMVL